MSLVLTRHPKDDDCGGAGNVLDDGGEGNGDGKERLAPFGPACVSITPGPVPVPLSKTSVSLPTDSLLLFCMLWLLTLLLSLRLDPTPLLPPERDRRLKNDNLCLKRSISR